MISTYSTLKVTPDWPGLLETHWSSCSYPGHFRGRLLKKRKTAKKRDTVSDSMLQLHRLVNSQPAGWNTVSTFSMGKGIDSIQVHFPAGKLGGFVLNRVDSSTPKRLKQLFPFQPGPKKQGNDEVMIMKHGLSLRSPNIPGLKSNRSFISEMLRARMCFFQGWNLLGGFLVVFVGVSCFPMKHYKKESRVLPH